MRITLSLSRTDLSLLAQRLAHWRSLGTVMPGTLRFVSTPLMIKHVQQPFSLTKSSCQKLPSLFIFLFLELELFVSKEKTWCISTNCHLKSAFIDRHCPAVLLTARSLPPRSTLRRVLHLSISSTPELREERERGVWNI